MLSQIILNFLAGFIVLSLTSSVALHDSRVDKAFVGALTPASNTAEHDLGHSLAHELHVHGSRQADMASDPLLSTRSHKKHTALHHARFKLATLVS